jgi:hypothetical protein
MATSTSRVHALPTPAFALARVFAAHVAGVAASDVHTLHVDLALTGGVSDLEPNTVAVDGNVRCKALVNQRPTLTRLAPEVRTTHGRRRQRRTIASDFRRSVFGDVGAQLAGSNRKRRTDPAAGS